MPVRDLSELRPEARAEIESYLSRLQAGFCGVASELAEETLAETRSHFLESLDSDSSVEDVKVLAAQLGEPDEYAVALCEEVTRRRGAKPSEDVAQPAGHVLGMPYDIKAPTPENLRTRIWNPEDPRIFTPKLVGLGWTINFAALAVKTGMIRPDDEDEPFASVPERYLWVALLIPVLAALALATAVALMWPTLPEQVAIHWDYTGVPDGWASAGVTLLVELALAVLPAMFALWFFASGRDKASRVLTTAAASMFVTVAGGVLVVTLAEAQGIRFGWAWPWVMIALTVGIPFVMLVALSRLGRAEEMKRDLGE